MLRRTYFLRPPAVAATTSSSSASATGKRFNNLFTKTRLATGAAVASAPVGYYYYQVYLPNARRTAELLKQQRPERSTPVFTTGGEPITSITQLVPKETSLFGFYVNSLLRLSQFFIRSSYVFLLLLKYAWNRATLFPVARKKDGKIDEEVTKAILSEKQQKQQQSKLQQEEEDKTNEIVVDKSQYDPILMQVGEELAKVFSDMGGSYVKLGQWCATRSDVFPREVCESLELLYDKARPHPWEETKRTLQEQGIWEAFESVDEIPVSSGTIAQVHKARLKQDAVARDRDRVDVWCKSSAIDSIIDDNGDRELLAKHKTITNQNQENGARSSESNSSIAVAVKVMHPRIREIILEDMQALRWATQLFNMLIPGGSYLGLTQAVEEFTALLYSQLDMVREAENLNEFRFNFRLSKNTVFPRPFLSLTTKDVLVETFEYGIALNSKYVDALTGVADGTDDFSVRAAQQQQQQQNNNNSGNSIIFKPPSVAKASKVTTIKPNDFSDLGTLAVEMFLKMVFEDNLVHADLHPGNILVRIVNSDGSYSLQRQGPRSHSQIVVLDPGLVTSMSERERENFIALFTCVATGDGDLGARLMLERSPEQHCKDEASFTNDMKKVFDRVTPRNLKIQEIDLAGIMREILDTMRHHRVRIDMNFASLVATVALGEGLGRRLVRDFNLFEAAMPFLLHCLKSHELHYMISKLHEMYLVDGMNMK